MNMYLYLLLVQPAEIVSLMSCEAACSEGPSGIFSGPVVGELRIERMYSKSEPLHGVVGAPRAVYPPTGGYVIHISVDLCKWSIRHTAGGGGRRLTFESTYGEIDWERGV
jgi:hypothetical protein